MRGIHALGVTAAFLIAGGVYGAEASAQSVGSEPTQRPRYGGGPSAMLTPNPFTNPYANPFLNPYAMQQPVDRESLLLYFLSAQKASGGLGSGQLSGLNSPAITGRGRGAGRPVAEMPRASNIPGAAAAGFFGRGISPSRGAAPYYQRHSRYFSSNGH